MRSALLKRPLDGAFRPLPLHKWLITALTEKPLVSFSSHWIWWQAVLTSVCDFQGTDISWGQRCMLSPLGTLASHEVMSYKCELYIHCKMPAPPPKRESRHPRSVLQPLCQSSECSLGNFRMQTLKRNAVNPHGMGWRDGLSPPGNSPAWRWQPAWSCAGLQSWHRHLQYNDLSVCPPAAAELLVAQPQSAARAGRELWWLLCGAASGMKQGHLPNGLHPVPPPITERAVHHYGSNAAAQIVAAIKKKNKKHTCQTIM